MEPTFVAPISIKRTGSSVFVFRKVRVLLFCVRICTFFLRAMGFTEKRCPLIKVVVSGVQEMGKENLWQSVGFSLPRIRVP